MGQLNYVPWPEMVVGHDGVSFRICFPGTCHFRHKVASMFSVATSMCFASSRFRHSLMAVIRQAGLVLEEA
jgi:hypothetical protein